LRWRLSLRPASPRATTTTCRRRSNTRPFKHDRGQLHEAARRGRDRHDRHDSVRYERRERQIQDRPSAIGIFDYTVQAQGHKVAQASTTAEPGKPLELDLALDPDPAAKRQRKPRR